MIRVSRFNINNIMCFHSRIYESLRTTNLKRVRIKTDPSKVASNEDFENVEGYEGYILGEALGRLRVLVLAPNMPIMDVPPEMLEHIYDEQTTDILNEFKNYIKEYLVKNKNKKQNDPVLQNIDNSTEYNEIEAFLKQNGVEGDELNKVYREFIERE
jgi:hypothetical protein